MPFCRKDYSAKACLGEFACEVINQIAVVSRAFPAAMPTPNKQNAECNMPKFENAHFAMTNSPRPHIWK
jgi:hypothetical protein